MSTVQLLVGNCEMVEGEGMPRELVPHRSRDDTTMKVLASH